MRLPVNHALPLAAMLLASGQGAVAHARDVTAATAPIGPAADYPVTVGEPFTIGGTTWTPADQLNYDAVGQAEVAQDLQGVSAAHKTLPLPSYAEVTSLASGRTILVRIIERGPMVNETLVALSGAAAAQLGVAAGAAVPIRVRRVNPPEVERAALRNGGTVPPRMDTPESLLKVLRRKLAEQSPLAPPPSVPPAMPRSLAAAPVSPKPIAAPPVPSEPITATSAPAAPKKAPAPAIKGGHVVQVAAFSTRERADKVAAQLNGRVDPAGRYWRVQLGPFRSGGEAAPALEKARAAGYRDARIQRAD